MGKTLSEMSLEELWQLFPVSLSPHNACWASWFEDEKQLLADTLNGLGTLRISHIGSTAIPGIMAKPIIDILIEISDRTTLRKAAALLAAKGYIIMSETNDRISLNKGYTEKGYSERVFHIHLHLMGDCKEIRFKDYLTGHPDTAREYEELKISLWHKFEHDRDSYTLGKTEFVNRYS